MNSKTFRTDSRDGRRSFRGHLRRERHRPRGQEVRSSESAPLRERVVQDGPDPGHQLVDLPHGARRQVQARARHHPEGGRISRFRFLTFWIFNNWYPKVYTG